MYIELRKLAIYENFFPSNYHNNILFINEEIFQIYETS